MIVAIFDIYFSKATDIHLLSRLEKWVHITYNNYYHYYLFIYLLKKGLQDFFND